MPDIGKWYESQQANEQMTRQKKECKNLEMGTGWCVTEQEGLDSVSRAK